jgi:Putative DNA-binding domain
MFAPFEASFARALLDAEQPIPNGITADNGANPARRFAVHRNNMVAGLVKVLKSHFPAVEKIVGEEFFVAMARTLIVAAPPRTPMLATYGDEFPTFIATFPPARELVYLADVARIEAARTRAYHAADATPVEAFEFAALDANTVHAIGVELHPSMAIVRSPHPIVTIWAMNTGRRDVAPIEDGDWCGEDALVVRPYLDVEVRLLPPGGAAFVLALAAARPLGEAAAAAMADHPDFDLKHNLAELIGSGLVWRIVWSDREQGGVS